MGLLTGMATLFHIHVDEERKARIRSEIDLMKAVEAHINWKLRLQNYMNGTSAENLDPMVICRDDQCELGKWIHGPATDHFHGVEAFHDLRADHAQFHYVAANVVKHVQAADRPTAEALICNEYTQVSHKVVMALTELSKLVEE
jgi:hypothetical protein